MRSEGDVGRLEGECVAGHDRLKRVVHARLDLRYRAKARIQVHEPGAQRCEPIADLPIDAHVGPSKTVDRLLGIADEEQRARPRPGASPIRLGVVVSGEQQQNLGLQRIRVLKLVDEDPLEARLESLTDDRVVAHEIARTEEQIEEVERACPRLQLVVPIDRAAKVALQERGEIGVRVHPELIESGLERDTRLQHAVAGHAIRVRSAAAGLCVGEDPIPGKIDESRLPPVVIVVVFPG